MHVLNVEHDEHLLSVCGNIEAVDESVRGKAAVVVSGISKTFKTDKGPTIAVNSKCSFNYKRIIMGGNFEKWDA